MSPRTNPSGAPTRRTSPLIALAVVAVALVALLAAPVQGSVPSLTARGAAVNLGALELSAARSSLAHTTPALPHPTGVVPSPGGYSWTNLSAGLTAQPSARLAAMAWDASDGYVLLWGWVTVGHGLSDTWSYANGVWTNITATTTGSPPNGAAYPMMAFDPSTQKVILLIPTFNATWTYHANTWTNVTGVAGTHPPSVTYGSLTTDSTDGEVMMLGGVNIWTSGANLATWVYKNGAWSNISVASPFNFGNIIVPLGSDDPADHGVLAVALSSYGSSAVHVVTFLFSAGVWTNLTPTLASEPNFHYLVQMAYLPAISAVILPTVAFINSTGAQVIDSTTWEFSHHAWTNVTLTTGVQPNCGLLASIAVDPVSSTAYMFGGERIVSPIVYPNTWSFSAAPSVGATASKAVVDAGQSVTFGSTVTGGVGPSTVHWTLSDGSSSNSSSVSHTFSSAGLQTATVTATDLTGRTATASASVYVNAAMTLALNASPGPSTTAGTSVALSAVVTGGTGPFTYAWTLGDGGTSTSPALGHAYKSSGTYTVNVTVTDATGATATGKLTVTVGSAPSTASSSASLTSGTGLGLLVVVIILALLVVALGVMLARKPKSPAPPTPYGMPPASSPPPAPSGGAATPPPGASGGAPPS